jgi:MraZ protein
MFFGTYRHSVDGKGRVALPAQFRKELGRGSVITIGSEGRLVIRPADDWKAYEQRFRLTSETAAEERKYIRFLYANTSPLEVDGQGRVLLTQDHRKFAEIRERAVFVGVGNCVEIIGEPVWDKENAAFTPSAFTELGDRLQQHDRSGGPV